MVNDIPGGIVPGSINGCLAAHANNGDHQATN